MKNEIFNKPFQTKIGELIVLKMLGKGKSGYSYLATKDKKNYVLKLMHDEPCSYYSFDKNKVELEVEAYNKLIDCNIPMPELIWYDLENEYLIKEFVDGEIASDIIAKNQVSDLVIQELFQIYHKVKNAGLNIDYFPTNFIITNDQLFYIDYECNSYVSEWNLINWGLYYWANANGFMNFLSTGDSAFINESADEGIPIKKPFEEKVSAWISKYNLG